MACNKPFLRYFNRGTSERTYAHSVPVPCGKCAACRRDLLTMWSDRCVFEAQTQKERSSFLTLTYNDTTLPLDGCVSPKDWDLFKDRLRKNLGRSVKFYMSSEYGSVNYRPHYHVMLFGFDWQNEKNYKALEKAWSINGKPLGYFQIDYLNPTRIRYTLKYMEKENNAEYLNDLALHGLKPTFHRMSKGIGKKWFFRPSSRDSCSPWLLCKRKVASFATLLSGLVRNFRFAS